MTGYLIGAAWGFSSVAAGLLIVRAIHAADLRDQVCEMQGPRSFRQYPADQRLERRGFAERGNNQPHAGASK
jgi:hypothetical protein